MMAGIPYWTELRAVALMAKGRRGQGSLEYIMMLSAVGIIIVVALAMVLQLKGTALHAFSNGTNQSISSELGNELQNLTKGS